MNGLSDEELTNAILTAIKRLSEEDRVKLVEKINDFLAKNKKNEEKK
ncbi:MAG TPA: hypothetical protein PKK26_09815 [Candidatus Wallbacteria bacterium]|nr:hypothetical protein [Candidatus Wallbacteria bacterium]